MEGETKQQSAVAEAGNEQNVAVAAEPTTAEAVAESKRELASIKSVMASLLVEMLRKHKRRLANINPDGKSKNKDMFERFSFTPNTAKLIEAVLGYFSDLKATVEISPGPCCRGCNKAILNTQKYTHCLTCGKFETNGWCLESGCQAKAKASACFQKKHFLFKDVAVVNANAIVTLDTAANVNDTTIAHAVFNSSFSYNDENYSGKFILIVPWCLMPLFCTVFTGLVVCASSDKNDCLCNRCAPLDMVKVKLALYAKSLVEQGFVVENFEDEVCSTAQAAKKAAAEAATAAVNSVEENEASIAAQTLADATLAASENCKCDFCNKCRSIVDEIYATFNFKSPDEAAETAAVAKDEEQLQNNGVAAMVV